MTTYAHTKRLERSAGGDYRTQQLPLVLFVGVLTLTYGFEVFSFNLTLDEELYGEFDNVSYAARWLEERRWAMSVVTLMVPSPVVPVVSTGLGVGLSGFAWWLLARRYLLLQPWQAFLACSLAGSLPVLAFIFAFSTIALGIGVGNCLLLVYFQGLSAGLWRHRFVGILAGAAAVGIYDSFLVALAALSLAQILRDQKPRSILIAFGAPALSLLTTRLLAASASVVFGIPSGAYVDRHISGLPLLQDPLRQFLTATYDAAKVAMLWEGSFGLHSPWLALALICLTILAIRAVMASLDSPSKKWIQLCALAGLLSLPVMAGLVTNAAPLRSLFYLPIIMLILASVSFRAEPARELVRRVGSIGLSAVVVLAVIGNATISNRLFASAQTAYTLDVQLASLIGLEKDKLLSGDRSAELSLIVSGRPSRPTGELTVKTETLGASFFEEDRGSARAAAFLRMHGIEVRTPTLEQADEARSELAEMPKYPEDGWVRLSGEKLLVKFGEPTP